MISTRPSWSVQHTGREDEILMSNRYSQSPECCLAGGIPLCEEEYLRVSFDVLDFLAVMSDQFTG